MRIRDRVVWLHIWPSQKLCDTFAARHLEWLVDNRRIAVPAPILPEDVMAALIYAVMNVGSKLQGSIFIETELNAIGNVIGCLARDGHVDQLRPLIMIMKGKADLYEVASRTWLEEFEP